MAFLAEGQIYRVKLQNFEGPLDLLLDLIEKEKLQINDVSLSKVADDYISYIKSVTEFPIGMSAHFILVASTLLLIKSKSLLPTLDLTEEEKLSIAELERRLKMLSRARELGRYVGMKFGENIIHFADYRSVQPIFSPHKKITIPNIFESMRDLLKSARTVTEPVPKALIHKVISLEEMVGNLISRVKKNLKLSFREFAGDHKERVNIIVSFLAMLELVKQGTIHVHQNSQFDEITMENNELGVPNYS